MTRQGQEIMLTSAPNVVGLSMPLLSHSEAW